MKYICYTTSSPLLQARCGSTSPGGQTQSPPRLSVQACSALSPHPEPATHRTGHVDEVWSIQRTAVIGFTQRRRSLHPRKGLEGRAHHVTSQSRGGWAGGLTRKGRERTSGEGRVRVLIRAVVTQAYTFVKTQTTLECVYCIVYTL